MRKVCRYFQTAFFVSYIPSHYFVVDFANVMSKDIAMVYDRQEMPGHSI